MLLLTHPACLGHLPGTMHPERPERLQRILQTLRAADLPGLVEAEAPAASRQQLLRVHTAAHVDRVFDNVPASGLFDFDADTFMSSGSLNAALHAAGATCAAVDAVMDGQYRRAFCAVRPPGHHATADTAMGFCLFNSVAAAAAHALHVHGLLRVAIVDFDVHHGNGSEAIFSAEPRVMYLSSHQMPLYPGTGEPGRHANNNIDAALPPGGGSVEFRHAWQEQLLPELDAFAPQLVLISAGFDADYRDPLADLQLRSDDFAWITRQLCAIADRHAEGRVVSSLEGGYDLDALGEGVLAHVRSLLDLPQARAF